VGPRGIGACGDHLVVVRLDLGEARPARRRWRGDGLGRSLRTRPRSLRGARRRRRTRADLGARLRGEVPGRVRRQIGRVELRDVFVAAERLGVVVRELHRAVISGDAAQRAGRVPEAVVTVVRLGQRHEDRPRLVALPGGDVLAEIEPGRDGDPELLRERDVVGGEHARVAQRRARARAIPRAQAHRGLVAIEREAPIVLLDQRVLHREQRDGVGPLLELLEQLTGLVDGVDVLVVELDDLAPVLRGAVLASEWRLTPELAELLVDAHQATADVGLRHGEGREQLHELLQQRDERLRLASLAIERREPLGGRGGRRILLDGGHEGPRGVVRVSDRHRPDVGALAQPVGRVRWIRRRHADLLEQDRVRAWIRGARLVGIGQRLFIVRISHETLDEHLHLPGVHGWGASYNGRPKTYTFE
jgi:hypothetical protein